MKQLIVLFSILVGSLMIASCAPQGSDEELESELSGLSVEELEAVTAEESSAVAGMAKANPKLLKLQRAYKKTAPTCSDTDGDPNFVPSLVPPTKNPFQKGAVSWTFGSSLGGPLEDSCGNDGFTLRENYCLASIRRTDLINCNLVGLSSVTNVPPGGSGLKCVDGACKSSTSSGEIQQPSKTQQPDLMIESAYFSLVLNVSTGKEDVKYTANVKNIGGNAGAFAVKAKPLFAGMASIDYVGYFFLPSLMAGETVTLTDKYSPYNVSWSACPGTHSLNITADYANGVSEADETNNGHKLEVSC